MKRYGRPDAIVTDRLRSYRAALRELGGSGLQQAGRWLNNRAENSHLPFRRRDHAMLRFRRMQSLQVALRPALPLLLYLPDGVTIATVQNPTLRSAGSEAIRQCPT